jgi:hypothetical protein
MKDITLYIFKREDGGTTVSPNKPNCECTTSHRLVADEGMTLTNDDEHFYSVIDTDSLDGWREVEQTEENTPRFIPKEYK